MHKPAKDNHFIKQPWYEGGPKALKQFVADHLRYPEPALAQRVEGTVTVRFDITTKATWWTPRPSAMSWATAVMRRHCGL